MTVFNIKIFEFANTPLIPGDYLASKTKHGKLQLLFSCVRIFNANNSHITFASIRDPSHIINAVNWIYDGDFGIRISASHGTI